DLMQIAEGNINFEGSSKNDDGLFGSASLIAKRIPGDALNFLMDEEQGSLSGEVDLNLKAKLKGQPSDHEYSFELNATKANIVKINPVEWFNTVSSEAF